ncbi:hypothetical protein D5018_06705 [Parashewanella curva]|uniref:Uncharacterized protein n=1 Tax=Parashewanella curva TaxID=2338552 RepID=A0A3L8PYF8_9GAMM|nr:hypothetical protein [Parashewanella curva]RLV60477.1 hypothetical protein D5018_06705 [Parashewanella curva]
MSSAVTETSHIGSMASEHQQFCDKLESFRPEFLEHLYTSTAVIARQLFICLDIDGKSLHDVLNVSNGQTPEQRTNKVFNAIRQAVNTSESPQPLSNKLSTCSKTLAQHLLILQIKWKRVY